MPLTRVDLAVNNKFRLKMELLVALACIWIFDAHFTLLPKRLVFIVHYISMQKGKCLIRRNGVQLMKDSKEWLTWNYRNMSPADRGTVATLFWIYRTSISVFLPHSSCYYCQYCTDWRCWELVFVPSKESWKKSYGFFPHLIMVMTTWFSCDLYFVERISFMLKLKFPFNQ